MTPRLPVRVAKWLGLGYAAAWIVYLSIEAPRGVLAANLLLAPFQLGPVAVAAMGVKASRTPAGAWLFVAVEIALVASAIWFIFAADVLGMWGALGGAIIFAFLGPILQYGSVAAVLLVACLFGWRARDSWLKDPA